MIDGKIDFYENDTIFITAKINGSIETPEISDGGEVFKKNGNTKNFNVKEIFEQGMQKLVDNILNTNNKLN